MTWFDLRALENKIANDQLTDKDGLKYFLMIFFVTAVPICFIDFKTTYYIDIIMSFVAILIAGWGIISSYKVNQKTDNKDFFNRFFALSWVIGIRIFAFFVISLILINFIKGFIPRRVLCSFGLGFFILFLLYIAGICLFNYLLIIRSLNRIKHKKMILAR